MKTIVVTLLLSLALPLWAGERDAALVRLRDGNARFAEGKPQAWSADAQKREELAVKGQHPFACIVTCSDSRVPPEILFDQTLGSLFVVRLAGNVVTPEAAASVEYAVEHLHVPVVVVLGHTHCGAVKAALEGGEPASGPMASLIGYIRKSIEAVRAKGFTESEMQAAVTNENARRGAEELMRCSRVVEHGVQSGEVTLLSALYDIHSGWVQWQMQLVAAVPPVETTPSVAAAPKPAEKAPEAHVATKPPTKKYTEEHSTDYAKRHR